MTLKTVPVTGILYNPDGSVAAGAAVVAQLTTVDTDGGVIVPGTVSTTTDAGGVFTLNLWPNSRGVNGSQYLLRGQMPGALPGVLLMNLKITVPDSDPSVPVPVSMITNRTLPSAMSDAKAAILGAQGFAVQSATSAGASAGSATAAAGSASAAAASRAAIDNRIYPGTFAAAPTTRPDGSVIQDGDRYTGTDGFAYSRISGVWVNQTQAAASSASAAAASATAASGSASAASTSATAAAGSAATASTAAGLLPPAIVSGSVRCNVPGITAAASGSLCFVFRSADYSVVQCSNPVVELWNGYCLGNGTHSTAAELGTGAALSVRYALLTGGPGTASANQAGATVWKATFYGMLSDPEFLAKGGTVSSDGFTITVPDGLRFRTDPIPGLRLAPLTRYFHQMEEVYQTGQLRITGDNGTGATLGDYRWTQTANTSSPVYATDWSVASGGTTPAAITGSTKMPLAVLGTGDGGPRSKLVAVEGDSIISNGSNVYVGTYGERSAVKTALIAGGYSFICPATPGTNMGDMQGWGGWRVRMGLLKNAYAVFTDHGHNDLGTSLGTFTANVLPLLQWHNGMLRAFARPGARIVRTTLTPWTSSTDSWKTLANQTYRTNADPATGWMAPFNAYALSAPGGPQGHDACWDMTTDMGMAADLKWLSPPDGITANYATADGTHPSALLHTNAAAALVSKLPTLIGF